MNCEEVDKLIADYSVGNLSDSVSQSVTLHLDNCVNCASELARLESVMSMVVENIGELEPPSDLWQSVSSRIAQKPWFGLMDRLQNAFFPPRRAIAFAVGFAAIAGAVVLGPSPKVPVHNADMAMMPYVADHAAASSDDAYADRVSLGFIASMSSDRGHSEQ